jgi:hypothetical protein
MGEQSVSDKRSTVQPYKVTIELTTDDSGDGNLSVDASPGIGRMEKLSSVNLVAGISGFQMRDMAHIPVAAKKVAKMMEAEMLEEEPQTNQPNFQPNRNSYL